MRSLWFIIILRSKAISDTIPLDIAPSISDIIDQETPLRVFVDQGSLFLIYQVLQDISFIHVVTTDIIRAQNHCGQPEGLHGDADCG